MHLVFTFVVLFGFWILLSGVFDAFHIVLGVISSLIVTYISHDMFILDRTKQGRLAELARFIFVYVPWLIKEIVLATLHVSYLALTPGMMKEIDPHIVRFRTRLRKDISKVVLANSITLTPGTITIRITGDEFHVHAVSRKAAEGMPAAMEEMIAKVFNERI